MKKLIALSVLLSSVTATFALPTWEPFSDQSGNSIGSVYANGTKLAGQTNASGEFWFDWNEGASTNNLILTNFSLSGVSLNGYGLPGPYATLPTNCVYVPNNPTTAGQGACLGFSQLIFPPAGKVSPLGAASTNRVFVSFLLDIPNTAAMGNAVFFAGLVPSNQVTGTKLSGGLPPAAPSSTHRLYFITNTTIQPYGLGVSDVNGATTTTGAFQTNNYDQANTLYFVVVDYEFAGTNTVTSTATNDKSTLWINPSSSTFGAAAAPATSTAYSGATYSVNPADVLTNAGGFYILARQAGTAPTNGFYIGAMAVGTTWSYVTGGPEFATAPANTNANAGQNLVLTSAAVAIAGQTVTYQWQKNGNNLGDGATGNGSTISGSSGASLTISATAPGDAGSYTVVATDPVSSVSATAVVTVDPVIVSYTTNVVVLGGGTGTLSVNDTTLTTGLTYQWQRNGVNLINGPSGTGTVYTNVQTATLGLSNISAADSGVPYYCIVSNASGGVLTNGPMTLTVNSLVVTQPTPASTNANFGTTVSFSASASPAGSYAYQWLLNGSPVTDPHASGTTTPTLTITGVSYIDVGSYTLRATGSQQAVSAIPAVLTVNDPYIITQPATQQANAGSAAIFSVSAAGSPTLSYQWYSNSVALSDVGGSVSGSHAASLTLAAVTDADDAVYNVTVNGGSGIPTNSAPATLTVLDPVAVATTMNSWTVNPGVHIAFAPTVTGTPPFTYQWLYNGSPLTGVTGSSLAISNVQTSNNGTYTVLITNTVVGGTAQASASATLTVTPTLITLPAANLVVARVGEGSQTLNTNQGNTLYLDQFAANGSYVATTMVPDSGPNALVVAGGGTDGLVESVLTTASNDLYINFAGFNLSLPKTSGNNLGTGTVRAIGAISGLGGYVLALTNSGLHSAGVQNRSAASQDGLYEFWSTGDTGGLQYVTPFANLNGQGIPTVSPGAYPDLRVIQLVSNLSTLYLSGGSNDAAQQDGLFYFNTGAPTGAASAASVVFNGNSTLDPNDFAVSPDGTTIYVADDNPTTNGVGGIQRWDNGGLSYVLPTGANSTAGTRGIVVNWSNFSGGVGAVVYATTAETSANRVVRVVDNGSGSIASTLETAGPNQLFRGIRFGLTTAPITFLTQPLSQTNLSGTTTTFSVQVAGSAPFNYQWYSNNVAVAGATSSTFTIPNTPPNASGSTFYVTVGNGVGAPVQSTTATLNVFTQPPSVSAMQSWTVAANSGARVVFAPVVGGSSPVITWTSNGVSVPVTTPSLSITNPTAVGVYTFQITVSSGFGPTVTSSATMTVVAQTPLSPANLVVARVGDGAQLLTTNLGNTLYMDQFHTSGAYVSTIMVPDSGSNACVVAGGSPEGVLESALTLSSNDAYLDFSGYNVTLPNNNGFDVGLGSQVNAANSSVRVIGALSGTGFYVRAVTNIGLYSAGDQMRSAGSSDGLVNFWTTGGGLGSSPGIKYITPTLFPNGSGIAEVAASGAADTRVVQCLSNSTLGSNFVYSSGSAGAPGVYLATGNLTTAATVTQLIASSGSPNDFAVSPDMATIYVADDGGAGSGGIQRWDTNTSSGGYSLSYTLVDSTIPGGTNGMRGLAVNWGSTATWGAGVLGAALYATTSEAATNRLISVVDNGSGSADTLLATAFPNELYRGVRFGPITIPLVIVTNPASQTVFAGQTVDFTVAVTGSAPYFYQWSSNGVAIPGATASVYSIASAQASNAGSYTVTINNGASAPVTSSPAAVLTVNPFTTGSGLVGWWQFNDGSGTNAIDSSSFNDTGSLSNFPASPWVAGLGGLGALNFANADGLNDNAVVVPDAPQLNFNSTLAFTLAAWINSATNSQISGAAIIAKGTGSGGEEYAFDIFVNGLRFYVRNSAGAVSSVTTASTPPVGQWEHVAATFDGRSGLMEIYVNGQPIGTNVTAPNTLLASSFPLSIGNRTASATNGFSLPFLGKMQDVRVYNVPLGQADIQAIYLNQDLAAAANPSHISTAAFVAGHLQLTFNGVAGSSFHLWSSTNLNLTPVTSQWTLLTTGTFDSTGAASFTDTSATGAAKYYVVTQP